MSKRKQKTTDTRSTKKQSICREKGKEKKQFRCSMSAIVSIFSIFSDHHKKIKAPHFEVMKKTPFYSLFRCLHLRKIDSSDCRRIDSVSEEIIRAFNPKSRKFKLGQAEVGLTKRDVQLIFGIVDGDRAMPKVKLGKQSEWSFCSRMFKGNNKLNQKLIKEKIGIVLGRGAKDARPDDVEDVVRLLCLLVIGSLFFPLNGVTLKWGWVEMVENLDEMRSYDWSGQILSVLVDSLVTTHQHPYQVKGCTILPLYWLCEHANIIPKREDLVGKKEMIPRLVKWHLPKMKDVISVKDIGGDQVVGDLEPTLREVRWYEELKKRTASVGQTVGEDIGDQTADAGEKCSEDVGEHNADIGEKLSGDLSDHKADCMSIDETDEVREESGNVELEQEQKHLEQELQQKNGAIEVENAMLKAQITADAGEKCSEDVGEHNADIGEKLSGDLSDHKADCMSIDETDEVREESGDVELEQEQKHLEQELKQKNGAVEVENAMLKAQIARLEEQIHVTHAVPIAFSVPSVDGEKLPYDELVRRWKGAEADLKRKDEEIWKSNEKVSSLSVEINELRGEYALKETEFREKVAHLEKKLQSRKPRPVDLDEDRWFSEIVEPIVHAVTLEHPPGIPVPVVNEGAKQNSMVRRIKENATKPDSFS